MTTKYSRFYGRASRSEFWKFILANFILLLIIATPVSLLSRDIAFLIELIMALYLLVIFIPGMALSTRRLHDINRSGWWLLLYLIPYLGAIALFFMFITEGDYLANSYGNPPRIDDMFRSRGVNVESQNSSNDISSQKEMMKSSSELSSAKVETQLPDVVETKMPEENKQLLPEGIKSIGKSMFKDNKELTEIEIPASVVEIEECAFSGCSRLKRVCFLGNATKKIDNSVFWHCESLASIVIPEGVEEIGDDMFWGCSSLVSARFPNTVKSIGNTTFFQCDKLTEVVLPNNLTSIGEDMFNGCSLLKSIQIPSTVTSIGNEAFRDCESLESFVMPNSVTKLGHAIFLDCKNLKEIKLSENITSLSNTMFGNCRSLSHIDIPSSVTALGSGVFLGCIGLKTFTIPAQISSIKSNPFQMISLHKLVSESSEFKVIGSALYDKEATRIISCFTKDSYFEIPESVTTIGDFAFAYKMSLEEVKCPTGLKTIGRDAFYMCWNLKEININPADVSIGRDAFADCTELKKEGIRTDRELTDDDIEWAMMELEAQANDYYDYVDLDFY